jgi:hypothetical protein
LEQRFNWEALRAGLGHAQELLALAEGSQWIGNLSEARVARPRQGLDLGHGSQHLWELGRAYGGEEA